MSDQNRLKRQFVRSNKKKTPKEALSNSKGLKSDQYLCLLQMYCKLITLDNLPQLIMFLSIIKRDTHNRPLL